MTISNKHGGLTSLELLVAVSIFAITLALATPSFNQIIQDNRASTQINGISSLMSYARSAAIVQAARVSVCPRAGATSTCGVDWSKGMIVWADTNGDGILDAVEKILRITDAIDTATITLAAVQKNSSTPVTVITYNTSGDLAGTVPVYFNLCVGHPTGTLTRLSISLVGHLTTSKGTC